MRHEMQGYWCFPLLLRRVLRWEPVAQNRGEMWQSVGVGVGWSALIRCECYPFVTALKSNYFRKYQREGISVFSAGRLP